MSTSDNLRDLQSKIVEMTAMIETDYPELYGFQ